MNASAKAYLAEYVADYDAVVDMLTSRGQFEFSACSANDMHHVPPRMTSNYDENDQDGGGEDDHYPHNAHIRSLVHSQRSYMACVSFTCTRVGRTRHECNYFPVMIGSRLDKVLSGTDVDENDNGEDDDIGNSPALGSLYRDPRLCRFLCGYFIMQGQVVNIPYLLTNNREKVHVQRQQRRHSVAVVLFVYNAVERGSVFKKWYHLPDLLFRDQEAREHYGAKITDAFDPRLVLNVEPRHVSVCDKAILFNLLHARKTAIDDFENKIILSPAVILKSLLTRTVVEGKKKNVKQMRRCIRDGLFSYFLSQTTKFYNSLPKRSSQNLVPLETNNMYRRPDAAQIGASVASFYQVIRQVRKYVTINKGFPDNAKGFLCHYDINCNIDNFAKTMALVPEVRVLCAPHDIHESILCALEDGTVPGVCFLKTSAPPLVLPGHILLLGVVPTRYYLGHMKNDEPTSSRYAKFMAMFLHLKYRFDSRVEVQFDADETSACRISIASINGTPLKRIENVYLTCWELRVLYPTAYASRALSCLSLLASPLEPYHQYEEVSKSISAVSQLRSRVTTARTAHLFSLTNNCTGAYICTDGWLPRNHLKAVSPVPFDGESFRLKTLICTSPLLNEDAYAVNERLNFNLLVKNKYDLTIPYNERLVIIRHRSKQNKTYQMIEGGRRDAVIVTLATVYSPQPLVVPWSSKLALMKVDKDVYVVYKCLAHSSLLTAVELDAIETRVQISRVDSNVYILFELQYRVPRYDGMKLSNLSGQKGLCVFTNLDKYSVGGVVPDVLVSAFSVLSRRPLIQLKEWASNTVSRSKNGDTLIGECAYYLLRNQSSEFKTHCYMKLDKLTQIILMLNDLNVSLYIKSQEAEPTPFTGAYRARFIFDLYRTLRVRYVFSKNNNEGGGDDSDVEAKETLRANDARDFWMNRLMPSSPKCE